MATIGHASESDAGLIGALRRLRDPLLLFAFPVTFALLDIFFRYLRSWPVDLVRS